MPADNSIAMGGFCAELVPEYENREDFDRIRDLEIEIAALEEEALRHLKTASTQFLGDPQLVKDVIQSLIDWPRRDQRMENNSQLTDYSCDSNPSTLITSGPQARKTSRARLSSSLTKLDASDWKAMYVPSGETDGFLL